VSKIDPIKYIFEKPALTERIARWQVLLSEFDIICVTQKAIKGSTLADYVEASFMLMIQVVLMMTKSPKE